MNNREAIRKAKSGCRSKLVPLRKLSNPRNFGLLLFLIATATQNSSYAKCVYDAEDGVMRDENSLLSLVTFILVVVVMAYPLKEWAEKNPLIALILVVGAPVLTSSLARGSCV